MPPAARIRDAHRCPEHGGGPVDAGASSVLIGMQRAAREGDSLVCGPATDRIAKGAANVIIDGMPAARLGDPTDHGGVVASGCFSVLIGTMDQSLALLRAAASEAPFCEECERAKRLSRQEALAEEAQAAAPAPAEEDEPDALDDSEETDALDEPADSEEFDEVEPPSAVTVLPMRADRAIGRALVTVVSGRDAFRKVVLSPGDVLRVGCGDDADLRLPHDTSLASTHFELRWDGLQGELLDRGKRGGTWLDGVRIAEGSLRHGSFIQAGSTLFSFHHEAYTPPRVKPSRTPAEATLVERAFATLSAERGLFGVFDAARDDRVLVLLREAEDEHRSLYEGLKGRALDDVAPYLVRFVPGSRLLRALVEEGWGKGWGLYLTSDRPGMDVRRHLRRFLIAADDTTNKRLYFRYYDPRIFRDFWPLATPRQRDDLLGEMGQFVVEGPDLGLVRVGRGEPAAGGK